MEPHNWLDVVRKYQEFGKDVSEEHVNLLIRRGISMALHQGGVPAVREFWDSIQDLGVISDPCFLAFTNSAIEAGDLDNIVVSNEYFTKRFLSHVREKFGPSALLPSIEVEGKVDAKREVHIFKYDCDVVHGLGLCYFYSLVCICFLLLTAQNASITTTLEEAVTPNQTSSHSIPSLPVPAPPLPMMASVPPTVDENGNILLDFLDDADFMSFSFDE